MQSPHYGLLLLFPTGLGDSPHRGPLFFSSVPRHALARSGVLAFFAGQRGGVKTTPTEPLHQKPLKRSKLAAVE